MEDSQQKSYKGPKILLPVFSLSKLGIPTPISELISKMPSNRHEEELYEAVRFGSCLELWHGNSLNVEFVNEAKASYKGIDFLLSSSLKPKAWTASQLIEYIPERSGVLNSDALGQWLLTKKKFKADPATHLLISVHSTKKGQMTLDLHILQTHLRNLNYKNVVIMGPSINKGLNLQTVLLIGVGKETFIGEFDLLNKKTLISSSKSPFFN